MKRLRGAVNVVFSRRERVLEECRHVVYGKSSSDLKCEKKTGKKKK